MGDSLNEGRVSTSSSGTDSPSPVQSPSPVVLHHHVPNPAPPPPPISGPAPLSAASVVSLNMAALTLTPQQKHRAGGGGGGLMTSSYASPPSVSYGDKMRLTSVSGPPSQYVKLNVGGCLHYTTIATLTKHDSMLRAMFSGRLEVLTDSEGWILIDRCGKQFPVVLNFLRDGAVALPESRREVLEILAEAKYYCIQSLIDLCQAWLEVTQKSEDNLPVCKIPIITSSKEEKALLQSTTRPAIKLLLNRHNNKYSYTSQSDDNLLKNLELFDKLIMRFHERVLFIKDVGAANEVCSWTFYGHGRKVTEVCCTSIVYATDKKHTKVEFPEARIYEEAMNILLYEPEPLCPSCMSFSLSNNNGANAGGNGCCQATGSGDDCGPLSGYCSDREQRSSQQKTRTVTRAAEV